MLISLVYVSSAVQTFDQRELFGLLEACRRNNALRNVTGLLLHISGNFMQALEGPEETVDALYRKIGLDPRHAQVLTILREPIVERQFPDWHMGFREFGTLPPEMQAQISSFIDEVNAKGALTLPQRVPPPLALLRRFAATMR